MLNLPAGVASAWGLTDGQTTTVAIGTVALRAIVGVGSVPALEVDKSVVAAASSIPVTTARWLPQTAWDSGMLETSENSVPEPLKRIITENDIRKARMEKRSIVVGPEQIVTPAARALGDELGVFA